MYPGCAPRWSWYSPAESTSPSANTARNSVPPHFREQTSIIFLPEPTTKRRGAGHDQQDAESRDHSGVQLQRGPSEVRALDHDVAHAVHGVGDGQHVRQALPHGRVAPDLY